MKKNRAGYTVGIVFVAIIVILMTVGYYLDKDYNDYMDRAIEAKATIIEVDRRRDSDDDVYYYCKINYEISNGDIYTTHVSYSTPMIVGEEVTIYYDPLDPHSIKREDDESPIIVIYVICGVLGVITFLIVLITYLNARKIERILSYNTMVDAKITGIRKYTYNAATESTPPTVVDCEYKSSSDGITYHYQLKYPNGSKIVKTIEDLRISTVHLYVNPNNLNEYYVDNEQFTRYYTN